MLAALLLLAGLVALIGGAELIIRGGTRVARRAGISPLVIGLTVVSIGTSTPELAVGIEAAADGVGEMAVGNIVGTNIVNLLLILGLSALIRPIALELRVLRIDLPAMAAAGVLMLLLSVDGDVSTTDGVIMVTLAVGYTVVIVVSSRAESARVKLEYPAESAPPSTVRHPHLATALELTILLAGIALVVVGADWLVQGAVRMATALGVSEVVIGLTVIAIGTSAPELATTILATLRGHRDIAVGNLIGSTVYNIGLIFGITAVAVPGVLPVTDELIGIDMPIMVLAILACIPIAARGRTMSRRAGGVFVAAYLVYLGYLLVART